MTDRSDAPGRPGLAPKWTSSAKSGVGTSLGRGGRLWFTLSHGIVNDWEGQNFTVTWEQP